MRVLFDIVHPAHVHFYRHLRSKLEAEGHDTLVIARDKDVTEQLLQAYDIPHRLIRRATGTSRVAQASELVRRVAGLVRAGRGFRPDIVLTRNPAGVQAARLLGAIGVFDTDDGKAAGIHYRTAAPFAHVITSPSSATDDFGPRHRPYPSYKALAYLHPDHFTPDPQGLPKDVIEGQPAFLVRVVSNTAVHDKRTRGFTPTTLRELVQALEPRGRVLVSSEGPLPPEVTRNRYELPPHRIHDLLAYCSLYVGDSGSMAAEAALLGIPAYRLSNWTGPDQYLAELDQTYGLVQRFAPDEFPFLVQEISRHLENVPDLLAVHGNRRAIMLADKEDTSAWYRTLLDELTART